MTNGINEITNGINEMTNGINEMTNGINEMTNGINEMTNGIEYENTLANMENRSGLVPSFKFPKEVICNISIWKDNEEIYMERETYLINTDDLLEEFLR